MAMVVILLHKCIILTFIPYEFMLMWILRKFLSDMNPIEAMDFTKSRLEGTKNNEEFLMSMNS